ncbi:MAG: hypothetical protein ACKOQ5_02975, partial [Solirubrobacterales bacterium]
MSDEDETGMEGKEEETAGTPEEAPVEGEAGTAGAEGSTEATSEPSSEASEEEVVVVESEEE